jgi:uncharacterized protein (DUF169 family)
MDYKMMPNKLHDILNMEERIVGIKLLKNSEIPEGYSANEQFTFCQFIMKAHEGHKLMAYKDNIVCANGAFALVFRPVPEKLLNGEFFERFDDIDFEPDVVVFETLPEHVMWLSLASIHTSGGP